MAGEIRRREFLQLVASGGLACLAGPGLRLCGGAGRAHGLISPGCRGSRVKVARLYLGGDLPYWPKPDLDFQKEIRFYEKQFDGLQDELPDIDFVVDELITSVDQVKKLKSELEKVDGILIIHLKMGVMGMIHEILRVGRPTTIFARPYSGHEWVRFGRLQRTDLGSKLACKLTSDFTQLGAAIRPFRAVHHLREAKILDLTERFPAQRVAAIEERFGTEIKQVKLDRVLELCNAVEEKQVRAEARRWIEKAQEVVEPSTEAILKSCRLALAFERLLDQENATVMTADCYGTMYEPLCRSYAYPCLGFARLNNMGLGGICQADLRSAMSHIIFQGLSGRPGYIANPTIDESRNAVIMAHCLGTPRMDGPDAPAAPYRLRSVMEREEGVTPQVDMRVGQKVTNITLVGAETLLYSTGTIIEAPRKRDGCRTKAVVEIDGDAAYLARNWTDGVHRVMCYGDLTEELEDFCRFAGVELVNEAVQPEESAWLRGPSQLAKIGASAPEVDSQAAGYEATLAVDGRPDTFWHTPWANDPPGFPHYMAFDLRQKRSLAGFVYLPRQDMPNGRIAEYEFQISADGENWTTVKKGKLSDTTDLQKVRFEKPVSARHIKLVALSEVNGHIFTSIAEFDIIGP